MAPPLRAGQRQGGINIFTPSVGNDWVLRGVDDFEGDGTADIVWQVHTGYCPVHGWFQAEVVSQPPREIFPVNRPFGAARRLIIGNDEIYAFATVWNDAPAEVKRSRVDPLDPQYWKVRARKGALA